MVRAAASVVLLRQDGRVLWVRRGDQLRFAGGFYAFPGGAVDASDAQVPLSNAAHLEKAEAACIAAAARELFEETGVLVVPGVSREERRPLRQALLDGSASFGDFLAARGLAVDARKFASAGRWITPPAMPIRFDARFYLVELPEGEEVEIWPGELSDGAFIAPAEALRLWEEGTALLHPPAWHTLKSLALAPSPREAGPWLLDPSRAPWKLPIEDYVVQRIELQRGVIMVPLRTPTLPPATHTNCFLLGDDLLQVVDPGSPWPEEQRLLSETLERLAADGRKAAGVILTHYHLDHVGGALALGLPIAATKETAARLDFKVDRIIEDGERLEAGPRGWRMLHLPGHTRGHLCLVEEKTGAVIAGDLIAGTGTVIIDPPEGDMADYLASLDRLLEEKPGALYPAHGPVVPAGVEKLRQYRAHRLEREGRVLAALSREPAAPAQLLPAAYPDVARELYPFAERSLLAHLIKLVREGRAAESSGRYFVR
jgi:glyoxylase-like metal-dependent hydrolase (beta-lactamase superfamily II)/8-oxo-dGTP pyrophosphatase MutT (NUDIX family)